MKRFKQIMLGLLVALLVAGLSGCFSSSSSSDDDDDDDDGNGEPEVVAEVRAYHASFDAGDVDIYVGDERVLEDVAYPLASPYLEVPASDLTVSIVPAGGELDDAVLTQEISPSEDGQYTLIVLGSVEAENLDATVIDDANEGVTEGFVKVRPAHLAVGAPEVDLYVTGLDDSLEDAEPVASGLAFGDISDSFIEAPAEVSRLRVTLAGSDTVIYDYVADFPQFEGAALLAGALNAAEGFSPILIGAATGSDSLPFLPLLDQQSELRVVHGSPDAGNVSVEVRRAGENGDWVTLVSELPYRADTGYARILGDFEYEAQVILEDQGNIAVSLPNIEPAPGNAYSVFALGSVAEDTVDFLIEGDRASPADEEEAGLRVVHGIADGPDVDVEAGDGEVTLVEDLEPLTATDFLELDAGEYSVEVVTSDGGDSVIGPADLALMGGSVYTVVALPVDEDGEERPNLLVIEDRALED